MGQGCKIALFVSAFALLSIKRLSLCWRQGNHLVADPIYAPSGGYDTNVLIRLPPLVGVEQRLQLAPRVTKLGKVFEAVSVDLVTTLPSA